MFYFDVLIFDLIWYVLESIGICVELGFLLFNSYENCVY